MWEDLQHPKKYLRKKASLGVLTAQDILLLHRFPNPAKQIAALDYIGTRNTYRIFGGGYTVRAYSSSLSGQDNIYKPGVCRYNELFLLWQDNKSLSLIFQCAWVPELISKCCS